MDDRQLFTREDVLELIWDEEDDEGPPEIMFPGSDEEFGLDEDDDENVKLGNKHKIMKQICDFKNRHDDTINEHNVLNFTNSDHR